MAAHANVAATWGIVFTSACISSRFEMRLSKRLDDSGMFNVNLSNLNKAGLRAATL
jgi:hypothetical protein